MVSFDKPEDTSLNLTISVLAMIFYNLLGSYRSAQVPDIWIGHVMGLGGFPR
jgi:hypothetical protein